MLGIPYEAFTKMNEGGMLVKSLDYLLTQLEDEIGKSSEKNEEYDLCLGLFK